MLTTKIHNQTASENSGISSNRRYRSGSNLSTDSSSTDSGNVNRNEEQDSLPLFGYVFNRFNWRNALQQGYTANITLFNKFTCCCTNVLNNRHSVFACNGNCNGSQHSRSVQLYKITETAPYLRFNPYILSGYRRTDYTIKDCIHSITYLHNESVNFFTHAFALLFFLLVVPFYLPWYERLDLRVLALTNVIGTVAPWLGSSVYHLFMCHKTGRDAYLFLLKLDVFGIWITQTVGAYITIYTSVCLYPILFQWIFLCTYIVLAFRCIYDAIWVGGIWRRRFCFLGLVVMRFWALYLRSISLKPENGSSMLHLCCQEMLPFIGALISGLNLPERLWPGKFDYFLNSHNLMHVLVMIGALHLHFAARQDLDFLASL